MASRTLPQSPPWALVLACASFTAFGLFVSPHALGSFIHARASDGEVDFVTPELLGGVRVALLSALPLAFLLPRLRSIAAREPVRPGTLRFRGYSIAAGVLAGALVAQGLARIAENPPLTTDAKFYLSTSLEIADTGGPVALAGRCIDGTYLECNRHPFYSAALAPIAERSDRFGDRARLFSLAGAVLALLLVLTVTRARFGDAPSLAAGALVLTNGTFLEQSTSVACESWQMAFAVLWIGLALRAKDNMRTWAATGAVLGLLWLTKGTGTLFLGATVALWIGRHRWRALRPVAVGLSAFVAVAWPLLWRNWNVYGSPLWNINSSKVFWLDEWKSFFDPAAMEVAGPGHYFANHDLTDIALRVASGATKELLHLLEIFSPLSPALALGFPLVVLAALFLAHDRCTALRTPLAVLFALYFVGFAWYAQVVQGWRFLAVLAPLLLLPLAGGVARLGLRWQRASGLGATALACIVLVHALGSGASHYRAARFTPADELDDVHAFLLENVGEKAHVHYLLGPSDSRTVDWDDRIRGERHPFPRTEAELERLLDQPWGRVVRYAVVEPPTGPRESRVSAAWVEDRPREGLVPTNPPAGWEVVARFPEDRPRVLVFQHAGT